MGRAERRRAQKCEEKAKTATYNLTRAQLDALVREKISGELDRVKQEATNGCYQSGDDSSAYSAA